MVYLYVHIHIHAHTVHDIRVQASVWMRQSTVSTSQTPSTPFADSQSLGLSKKAVLR